MEMWEQKGRTEKGVKGVGVGAGFISSEIKVKQRCPYVLRLLLSVNNSSGLMCGIAEVRSSPGRLQFFHGRREADPSVIQLITCNPPNYTASMELFRKERKG